MKRGRPARTEITEREHAMAAAYREGQTLAVIGAEHGVSRERVRQILTLRFGIRRKQGGAYNRHRAAALDRAMKRDSDCLRDRGCTWAQYRWLRAMYKPTRAYSMQRSNAHKRGIAWELNLWQWWTIWQESGHWERRGRGSNGYVMCRKGDAGPYSADNVFIARACENSSDRADKKSSLPTGVSRARNKYRAVRMVCGEKLYLGNYDTAEAAHAAYLAADPLREAA